MSADKKREKPAIEVSREPACGVTHVSGVYGTITPFLGQVAFYYDVPEIGAGEDGEMVVESIQRRIVFDARMSPETFRTIAFWMMDQVEHYDRQVQRKGGVQ
ncbi:MAG: hypothetical protein M0P17_02150 [Methanoculleus sp.]|nr:hypothetical protein [Methanoculleus sp.]MDD4253632.1 hypothetical protein [Methanoculleus horonobensis]